MELLTQQAAGGLVDARLINQAAVDEFLDQRRVTVAAELVDADVDRRVGTLRRGEVLEAPTIWAERQSTDLLAFEQAPVGHDYAVETQTAADVAYRM